MSISPYKEPLARPAAPIDRNWPEKYKFILIQDKAELENVFNQNVGKPVAFDTETTGLDFEKDHTVGFSFSWDGVTGYYVPIRHSRKEWNINCDPKEALSLLHQCLLKASLVFYANRRFDDGVMEYEGWEEKYINEIDADSWGGFNMENVKGIDVLHFCFLFDTDNFKMIGLKAASAHFLGIKQQEFEEASGGASFQYTNPKDSCYYAASDAICTFKLGRLVISKGGIWEHCKQSSQIDNSFLYPLAKCEREKIKVDLDLLKVFENKVLKELEDIKEEIFEAAGYVFNLNSSKQVQQLFMELGIDTGVYTEGGSMSVGGKTIDNLDDEIIEEYPFLKKYKRYKVLEKMRSSYIEVFNRVKNNNKNYVRVPYKTTGVATGRLASGIGKDTKGSQYNTASLNLQNLPKQSPQNYYIFDTGNRGLWYEDIKDQSIPYIVNAGYIMVPTIEHNNRPIPIEDSRIVSMKNQIIEELEEQLDIEIKDPKFVGITESGSPKLNIRAMLSGYPLKNEKYLRVDIENQSYYLEKDGIDGVYDTEDNFYSADDLISMKNYNELDITKIISGGIEINI